MTTASAWPLRTGARERNRTALLEAAAELARKHGYGGTSLAAVAERAGLSTGAVYSIFGSKVELFIEVLLPDWHVLQADDLPAGPTEVPSFLEAYARRWVARHRAGDTRRAFEMQLELYLAALRDPRLLAKTKQIFESSEQRLAAHLEQLASGDPAGLPPQELARALVAAMQGLSQLAVALGEEPDEEAFVRVARRLGEPAENGVRPTPE